MFGNFDELSKFKYTNESGPLFISIDVTRKCNYKCLHCYNDSGCPTDEELTDAELLDAVIQAAELKPISMCLCGGEPMLRTNIIELIKAGREKGSAINMVSNGSLINNENIMAIKEAGLETLQISLDGMNNMQHDTFRGYVGAFDNAINAMKLGIEAGLNVITSFIPNKMNFATINEYFALCYELGLAEVRIMPLIPMGRGSNIDFLLLSSDEYFVLQKDILIAKQKYMSKGMRIEWGDPLDHYVRFTRNAEIGIKSAQLEIKSNGNLTISTYIPVVVGNVKKHSLQAYWEGGYKDIWARMEVVEYVGKLQNIFDINNLEPRPYSGEYYMLEIL
ncbi:MoaA/NifB/PqqE/SkfB family radical SAM enzyme [Lachnospiraceae bacterium PM6-15]|uniref:radical SAM protein n=1 Tax=Ohessyouella blattaphilus TaxID=2949333 RepID=UPI003E2A5883